ncbi:preprotein translocase subunit SecE [Mycoplasma sp. T363T]|uniref:Preprotein translocase subunit SecE n=1 Tax=Mycoplasma bradburyae TaxID=2963128 RepID=A0AAW6HPE4_9MOLU|nr:preprotein translocase subunit SecE [Mycoplasma bradburyae]MDC4163594.1 preprotein translocase subunit SecE [Mycoplasma bradburyae]MDC4182191.1 preprotein translocase subunit SecE [Mycoplasma bradburyae]MDC4182961.1 preprotein translocase subunit SecE [Mycoplasma bradburyae]MDC4183697.1 preprotein translocase subunit SecE [Mycoplasma bradburyae]UTS70017.1 preprotein translocase subunit SecE [Mycoplasma bradburyae]
MDNKNKNINLRKSPKVILESYQDDNIKKEQQKIKEQALEEKKLKEQKEEEEYQEQRRREKANKVAFSYRLKRWWFGMEKESRRISWCTPKMLVTNFLIVIVVVALLTGLLFGIDQIFYSVGILK